MAEKWELLMPVLPGVTGVPSTSRRVNLSVLCKVLGDP